MSYPVSTLCERGNIRANNEDAISFGFHVPLAAQWMVVADGMGGHLAGEVASKLLVEHVQAQMSKLQALPEEGWQVWLKQQLSQANEIIYNQAQNDQALQGMGTTGVLVVLVNMTCHIAWVGDSRAYLMRQQQLQQLTEDHTMIQFLLNKGAISAKEAQKANNKNLLSKAFGSKASIEVDYSQIPLAGDDVVMLSSDGLHDFLTTAELLTYLDNFRANPTQGSAICQQMYLHALEAKSKDNITLGLIAVEE